MKTIAILYLLPMLIMLVVHLVFRVCKNDAELTDSEQFDFAWAEKETRFIAFLPGVNLIIVVILIWGLATSKWK